MFEKIKNLSWYWFLPVLLLVHLWSMAGVTWPVWNLVGFIVLALLCLLLAIRNMKLALALFFLELIIGSKGYIFSLEIGNLALSIRIAMWFIIMAVWLIKFLLHFKDNWSELKKIFKTKSGKFLLVLSLACLLSVIIGLGRNTFSNLFFDANNWVFLLIALPVWFNFKTKEDLQILLKTFYLGVSWLAIETLIFGFIFSHDFKTLPATIYQWLRYTGLAEPTWTPNGFWRIFLQSHLYLVFALLGLFLVSVRQKKSNRQILLVTSGLGVLLSAVFFSLSRSLWLGLALGMIMIFVYLLPSWKKIGKYLLICVSSLGLAYIFVWLILTTYLGGGSSLGALVDRANVTTEAAASSRWNLLPVIWGEIKVKPILGQGFGATIIYRSQDPRVLKQNAQGWYETYAFEWGWLDLWLKLGLWGMLAYLLWLLVMIRDLLKLKRTGASWLAFSLISLAFIHFFTPYLNHPLGLIVVIICAQALKIWQEEK